MVGIDISLTVFIFTKSISRVQNHIIRTANRYSRTLLFLQHVSFPLITLLWHQIDISTLHYFLQHVSFLFFTKDPIIFITTRKPTWAAMLFFITWGKFGLSITPPEFVPDSCVIFYTMNNQSKVESRKLRMKRMSIYIASVVCKQSQIYAIKIYKRSCVKGRIKGKKIWSEFWKHEQW